MQDDTPGLDHVAPMRHAQCHPRVLLDEQDRRPLAVDVLDDAEDRLDEDRRQAHRGLVEQEQLRSRHQRATDCEHLLLAARKRATFLGETLAQPREQREDALEIGRDPVAVATREGAELEVLEHAHAGEDVTALRRLCDAQPDDAVGGQRVDARAVEGHAATPGPDEAEDRAQGRRLPGAVAADERDDLAALDRQ